MSNECDKCGEHFLECTCFKFSSILTIDCISDLHGSYPDLPGGDLLIIAGDLTARHTEEEFMQFLDWMRPLKYRKKIFIAGNHDAFLERGINKKVWESYQFDDSQGINCATYLCDSGTEFEGLNIWGSAWTLSFEGMNPNCKAFTLNSEQEIEKKWDKIPEGIDILITHSPPYGFLDESIHPYNRKYIHRGSKSLLHKVLEIRPRLHIFGHIHEGNGSAAISVSDDKHQFIEFVNCAHMSKCYEPINRHTRVKI